jgi:hypothetical protein
MSNISVLKWNYEGGQWMAWVNGTAMYVVKLVIIDDLDFEWQLRLQNVLAGTNELIAVGGSCEEVQNAAHDHSGDCG